MPTALHSVEKRGRKTTFPSVVRCFHLTTCATVRWGASDSAKKKLALLHYEMRPALHSVVKEVIPPLTPPDTRRGIVVVVYNSPPAFRRSTRRERR